MWKKRFGKKLLGRYGVFLEHVSQIYDPTRAHDEIADVVIQSEFYREYDDYINDFSAILPAVKLLYTLKC